MYDSAIARLACYCLALLAMLAVFFCGTCAVAVERQSLGSTQQDVVLEKLQHRSDWEFVETPLRDAVELFISQCDLNVLLDRKALEEVGIGTDIGVTFKAKNLTAQVALESMLRPLQLTWIERNGLVLITTPEVVESNLETRVYNVRDLLEKSVDYYGRASYDFDSLIEIVTSTVQPNTWDQVGGPGSVQPYTNGFEVGLVINTTMHIHFELDALFATLRRLPVAAKRRVPNATIGQPSNGAAQERSSSRASSQPVVRVRRTTLAPSWPPVASP